jgi:hypothetical protein
MQKENGTQLMKMNTRILAPLLSAALILMAGAPLGLAQTPPTGLAGEIIQARQKNAAMMRQYSWVAGGGGGDRSWGGGFRR